MKNAIIIVAGITFTRAQIENALEELNAPEYIPKPGDVFTVGQYSSKKFLAVDPETASYRSAYAAPPKGVMAISLDDGKLSWDFQPQLFTFTEVPK